MAPLLWPCPTLLGLKLLNFFFKNLFLTYRTTSTTYTPEAGLVQVIREILSAPIHRRTPPLQTGRVQLNGGSRGLPVRRLFTRGQLPVGLPLRRIGFLGLVVLCLTGECAVLRPVGLQGELVGGGAVLRHRIEVEEHLTVANFASRKIHG
jgi:hypothetical protein